LSSTSVAGPVSKPTPPNHWATNTKGRAMKLATHVLAALLAASLTQSATAAQFTHDGNDGRYLYLTGAIGEDDDRNFERALDGNVEIIVLTSTGGLLAEAENIARVIRRRGLRTEVPVNCSSACVLAWSAGKPRTVSGKLSVHCATLLGSPRQCDTAGRERMIGFLREMNAPAGVIRMQEAANWMALEVTAEQLAEGPEAVPMPKGRPKALVVADGGAYPP